jgi:glycerol-3-phosphate acyltransferase PlsY
VDRLALSVLLGYIIGSIPTAYVLVRWKSRVDIRKTGSGNVGTLNSFLVTRSWSVGAIVLIVDLLKGSGAVLVGSLVGGGTAIAAVSAGISAILGHIFPIWLEFRGGKGLAPAAGAVLAIIWVVVPVWMFFWLCSFAVMRNTDPANAFASVIVLALAAGIPPEVYAHFAGLYDAGVLRWFVVLVMGIILLRHVVPVKEYFAIRKMRVR